MASTPDLIRIQTDPLSADEVLRHLQHSPDGVEVPTGASGAAGAFVLFSGVVRAREGDATIPALDYEHYAGMAEKELARLAAEARARWPLERVALVHRVGRVGVGESSVLVGVAAGHRAEAFEAARWLIDELKERVPIWKGMKRQG